MKIAEMENNWKRLPQVDERNEMLDACNNAIIQKRDICYNNYEMNIRNKKGNKTFRERRSNILGGNTNDS